MAGWTLGAYEFGIGDYNCDRTVDLLDFARWPECMTGPHGTAQKTTAHRAVSHQAPAPGCDSFDFNADGEVDLADLHGLLDLNLTPGP